MKRPKPDIQQRLRLHIFASERMAEMATRAHQYYLAGDVKKAKKFLAEADEWRERLELIEGETTAVKRST